MAINSEDLVEKVLLGQGRRLVVTELRLVLGPSLLTDSIGR
jgi:hypothetical protein